jgi:hypothetical protein
MNTKKLLKVLYIFIYWIVVMVTYVQAHQIANISHTNAVLAYRYCILRKVGDGDGVPTKLSNITGHGTPGKFV